MEAVLAARFRAVWQGPDVPDELLRRAAKGLAKGWLDYKINTLLTFRDINASHPDHELIETYGRRCYECLFLESPDEQESLVDVLCRGLRELIKRDGVENVKASNWHAVPVSLPHLP